MNATIEIETVDIELTQSECDKYSLELSIIEPAESAMGDFVSVSGTRDNIEKFIRESYCVGLSDEEVSETLSGITLPVS